MNSSKMRQITTPSTTGLSDLSKHGLQGSGWNILKLTVTQKLCLVCPVVSVMGRPAIWVVTSMQTELKKLHGLY